MERCEDEDGDPTFPFQFGFVDEDCCDMPAPDPSIPGVSYPAPRPHQSSAPAWLQEPQRPLSPPPESSLHTQHDRLDACLRDSDHSQDRGHDQAHSHEPELDRDMEIINSPMHDFESSENGRLVTRKEVQQQIVKVIKESGKLSVLVGQATAEWWRSAEMQRRKRAAGRTMLHLGSSVAAGAGNVFMYKTPLARVTGAVASNVNAFRAAPFRHSMQSLGLATKSPSETTTPPNINTPRHDSDDDDFEFINATPLGLGIDEEDEYY